MEYDFYRIIFFGSSDFAVPVLKKLLDNNWKVVAVITQPDRASGREGALKPTPVKNFATRKKLQVASPVNLKSQDAYDLVRSFRADLAIVASYGVIIPGPMLKLARLGYVNLHPSLLPKYRGPSPIQSAILNGEISTGVTIIELDEKMDHGPIIAQAEVEIKNRDEYPALHDRLAEKSADLLVEKLPDWIMGKISSQHQDDRRATFTKTLSRVDGKIDWKKPSSSIYRQMRAFTPWPGVWAELNGTRHKILKAKIGHDAPELTPGQIVASDSQMFVGCGNKSSLEIKKIQPEGRKEMPVDEFLRGRAVHGKFFT